MSTNEWHVIFNGSGSVTGNDWIEEVCYLGNEEWLLRLYDDPIWSLSPAAQEQCDQKTSSKLVEWVRLIDTAEFEENFDRRRTLLEIADNVGAEQCTQMLKAELSKH